MHSWSLKHQLRGKEDFEGEGEEEEGEEEGMETDYSDMEVDPQQGHQVCLASLVRQILRSNRVGSQVPYNG